MKNGSKKMRVCALITARAGSKSVPGKNTMLVDGVPLFYHNVVAASESQSIDEIYVTTDCKTIKAYRDLAECKYKIIDRPDHLCSDDSSHHDVMIHAIEEIERVSGQFDVLVVLLGNARGASSSDLEKALLMIRDNYFDSVLSVSEFNMFNPFRAYHSNEDGVLDTIVPQKMIENLKVSTNINDRKAAGDCLFFNGAFMITKPDIVRSKKGKYPFPWLGHTIASYRMPVVMELDASWQILHIKSEQHH